MTDGFQIMPGLNVNQKQHSVIFFNRTCLWSTWLTKNWFVKNCSWALPHSVCHFSWKPSFCTERLVQKLCCKPPAISGCDSGLLFSRAGGTPLPLSQLQPSHFLWEAVGRSLQVLCCPPVLAVGAGPAFAQSGMDFTARVQSPRQVLRERFDFVPLLLFHAS